MKIYVRDVHEVYETRLYKPFMYKDVMYGTVERKKIYYSRAGKYKYYIVHILTGQAISTCKSKNVKDNVGRLKEIEKVFSATVADALTKKFGDEVSANINADQWNKLIVTLEGNK